MAKIKKENPDIIVLNAKLDARGSLEMFDDLKTDQALSNIPVILLSSIDEKTLCHLRRPCETTPGRPIRPDGFLEKPPEGG